MVVISIKSNDGNGDGFLFETTTDATNDDLISSLVEIQNLRLRSRVIVDSVRGLAEYSHGGSSQSRNGDGSGSSSGSGSGSDEIQDTLNNMTIKDDETIESSFSSRNNPPTDPLILKALLQTAQDLEEYTDKAQVQKRVALQKDIILDKISNIRGAVIMAYPMGLPAQDLVKISLDHDSLEETFVANEILDPQKTSLWCAGKEFLRGEKVSNRLGLNEKTKVIAKLQTEGSGPPGREPVVNEEERKAMMAHYFKRQEELKRLAEAEDDEYLNSRWADSKEMKRSLQGLDGIKAPGLRFS